MTSSYLSPTSLNRHIMDVIHPCPALAYHEDRPTKPTDFDLVVNLVLGYLTDKPTNSVGLSAPTKPTVFDLVISLVLGYSTDKPTDRQIPSVCRHRQNRQFLT